MTLILIVVVVLLLFGGGGFYGYRSGYYGRGWRTTTTRTWRRTA